MRIKLMDIEFCVFYLILFCFSIDGQGYMCELI